ncbi:CCA tRNA nucleotidyltransferase [Spirulina subsalsa]|uniref:CCA tRNA nucleotidyltransferase n=1 Tax=Spirulina subsalsa TaxID=54311 RepID=UPI000304CEF9|nr:CCA tRNA nucleotidyltransferase [Spirulina subsalsa]
MNVQSALAALTGEKLPFSLDLLPDPVYVVGGAVRDALLGRQSPYLDLDFIVPQKAVEIARGIAQQCRAGFVILDPERNITRLVFAQGTVDFAQQDGESLETDLNRRDFRMNAIAYNPRTQELIDPLKGQQDIEEGVIQAISKHNLKNDPLRLLRAYRQAAQLNFTIKPHTRSLIRKLAPHLEQVAAERIQQELNYLLNSPHSHTWFQAAWDDHILPMIFPDLKAKHLQTLEPIEQAAWLVGKIWTDLDQQLQQPFHHQSLSGLSLAKLVSLLPQKPNTATRQLEKLKYSRAEIRAASLSLRYLPHLLNFIKQPMSLEEQYFFFQEVGDTFPIVTILAIALAAHQDIIRETRFVGIIAPLINAYLDPNSLVAHPTPLITGNDLIEQLCLSPSPQIGELLTQIQLARIKGQVHTKEEALNFAQLWLRRQA